MVSNALSKWWTIFCLKASNFVYFGPYEFVQISPAYCPNTYQIIYGESLDFQRQHQQYGYIKYPIGNTVANADIGSPKFL